MVDTLQVFWSPAGENMPSLGARALVDITDGDTPNVRVPIRMLSVDTPETTARSPERAAAIDEEFAQLARWITDGRAPIEAPLAQFLLPKLETGRAGTLHWSQGKAASAFAEQNVQARLQRPGGSGRSLFIRTAETPFDNYHRLLAYVAPNYSSKELREIPRDQRPTFNLDLVTHGWAATFVFYPSIPGALDLPLLVQHAATARTTGRGVWAEEATLLAYEYRAMEKLYRITRKIVNDEPLRSGEAFSWRERYCVDIRTRVLHGPEDYFRVEPEYRLWLWPGDINEAVGRLNLTPAPALVNPR